MPDGATHLEVRVSALEEDSRRNQTTHKEFYDKFEGLNVNNARVEEKYNNILSTLGRVETQVNELATKPAKRWDGIIMAIITAAVGVLMGIIFTRGI